MNLDDELRSALQRQEPPPEFAERVLARVAAVPVRMPRPWFRLPVMRWAAAMAATVMLLAGGLEYRHYEGERAKAQVLLAVRIAANKLNKVQRKVQMISHRSNS